MTAEPDINLERNPFTQPMGVEGEDDPTRVVDAAERLKRSAGENVRRLREAAEAGIQSFRDSGDGEAGDPLQRQSLEEIQAKLKELHREGEAWARENPTAAVAIAAGAGFLLGMLLRR